eukprot:364406-Prymnesium_polylepis.1
MAEAGAPRVAQLAEVEGEVAAVPVETVGSALLCAVVGPSGVQNMRAIENGATPDDHDVGTVRCRCDGATRAAKDPSVDVHRSARDGERSGIGVREMWCRGCHGEAA